MHTYRKRIIIVYYALLLIFFIVFLFAYVQLKRQIPILHMGFSYYVEDMLIIILSFFSMLKVVYEIYNVEHHHEYERRVRETI